MRWTLVFSVLGWFAFVAVCIKACDGFMVW